MNNKKTSLILANFLFFAISVPSINAINFQMPETPSMDEVFGGERKIVVFKENATNEQRLDALADVRSKVIKKFNLAIKADVVERLSQKEEISLANNPLVERIDPDIKVYALAQTLPWGVDRIDADLVFSASPTPSATPITGLRVKVAVIDTGIDLYHSDLSANIKGGYNAIRPSRLPNDDNGHGTHVAGTIAALNNTYGVVGAGPQIYLYSVKVLDKRGSGWLSDIIEGIDWSIANQMQVINMSLGTTSNVQSFHDAVIRAKNAGVVVVAAAGNNGGAVNYPAAYSESVAVSAMDSAGNIASWSSRGAEVDLAAPGVSIYSTYRANTYKTLSGTSMASPHVAGAAALVLKARGCTALLQANCTPDDIQTQLESTAEQLPQDTTPGKDSLYGSGLVDAFAAVQ